MIELPCQLRHIGVTPIKCQGIKTKLVPFIFGNIKWSSKAGGKWIEPFLGSGVVALNLDPERALLADSNIHIIHLYQGIQKDNINRHTVREFLVEQGKKLEVGGDSYYYEVRERFNKTGSPFDFLFLNRSCFNGLMRFNSNGNFNVPFCHKPKRFSQAYITKIANQVDWVSKRIKGKDWEFRIANWEEILLEARENDFVYIDPPYIGRHTDYYNAWNEEEAKRLAKVTKNLSCGFAVSMWSQNRHRKNPHLTECWSKMKIRIFRHFYHVGSKEKFRNEMDEALVIRPGFEAKNSYLKSQDMKLVDQLPLILS